jgi:hypothetical protein
MSQKFHLTSDGPKPCHASLKCPLGGEHFTNMSSAEEAYAQTMGGSFSEPESETMKRKVITQVEPQAGGRYFGCSMPRESLAPSINKWKGLLGERAQVLETNKASRDRGNIYHMTVVGPPEMKNSASFTDFPATINVEYLGVGSANDGSNEAWFVVCRSPEVAHWRQQNNLSPKDLHITLGFDAKDVHTEKKDESSIIIK